MTQHRSSHLLRYNHRVSTSVGVQDLSQAYVFLGYSWMQELNGTGHSDRDRTKSHCGEGFCFFEKLPGEELRHPKWDSAAKIEKLEKVECSAGETSGFWWCLSQWSCPTQLHGMAFTWTSALGVMQHATYPTKHTHLGLTGHAGFPQSLLLSRLSPITSTGSTSKPGNPCVYLLELLKQSLWIAGRHNPSCL